MIYQQGRLSKTVMIRLRPGEELIEGIRSVQRPDPETEMNLYAFIK